MNVNHIEVWKNIYKDFVVALRGADGKSIIDDTGEKEEATFNRKKDAMDSAKRLAKHYGVQIKIHRTAA
jgi:hypothetical protein